MRDALKGRRLLIAAAVVTAVMVGVGAAAQAGLLSRAETSDTHSRAAAAAIADPQGNGDVIAVAETEATREVEGENSANATLLRVGDTKIGETPKGYTSPLSVLNDQPTEALVDAGCDGPAYPPAPLCVGLLQSQVNDDAEGGFTGASIVVAQVGSPAVGYYGVLASGAFQGPCPSGDSAVGAVVFDLNNIFPGSSIDPSMSQAPCEQPPPACNVEENPECADPGDD